MNSQSLRRRFHGPVDDLPPTVLGNPSLASPFPASFAHPTSPASAFTWDQSGAIATSFSFPGIPPQEAAGIDQHYHQHQVFQHREDDYPYHHQTVYREQQQFTQLPPGKRQRLDTNMQIPCLSRACDSYDDGDTSPQSGYPHDEGTSQVIYQEWGSCFSFCPPFSANETAPGYQAMSSNPMYETPSRAFSADLQSPNVPGLPQHAEVISPGVEPPDFLNDFSHHPANDRQLQIEYPTLQPTQSTMPQNMQSTLQQNKPFGHQNAHGNPPKAETSPKFVKLENPEQDFHGNDFTVTPAHAHPVDIKYPAVDIKYQPSGPMNPEPRMYTHHDMGASQPYISHALVASLPVNPGHYDYLPLASQEDLPVPMESQKPPPTRRGPFKDPQKRELTAQVRKIGSCIRCRMQRIRCEFDPGSTDDENAPCEGCRKIVANSKIHRLPCRRWKLVDVKLSKDGNLEWTYRWKDSTSLPEITQWNDTIDREIALYDGYQEAAIIGVKIRMFKLVPGDQESRKYWNYKTNREERIEMEPYGLVDVADAKLKYEEYLRNSQEHLFDKLLGPGENLLRKTYDLAIMRRDSPQTSPEEQDLLDRTLRLWVAIRLTTNSFYFRDKNKAYNRSESDRKILLHPVFGQQIDRLLLDHILSKLRRETLEVLQSMTQQKKQKTWLTTYLVSFILLHNVSLITNHDRGRAEKHGRNADKKSLAVWYKADNVKQYHLGANIFLAYFHYCNKGTYPFSDDCKTSDLQNLAELDRETIEFVMWTRKQIGQHKSTWDSLREKGFKGASGKNADEHKGLSEAYSNDYFFVSQLFEKNWVPRDTIVDKNACKIFGPARGEGRSSTRP